MLHPSTAVDMKVLLFGDQAGDTYPILRRLVVVKGNPLLESFLERAYRLIRSEISRQPRFPRNFPKFDSIAELIWRYADSEVSSPAIDSSLTLISQIGCILRGHSRNDLNQHWPLENTQILGSCTGLLAAAAVACSRTLPELLDVSIELLKVAFNIGTTVAEVRNGIEHGDAKPQSWAAVISGISKDAASDRIEDFHTANGIAPMNRAYISATSSNTITISGPPRTLDRLFRSEFLKGIRPLQLPISGPYHAAHIYSDATISSILAVPSLQSISSLRPLVPIFSSGSGQATSSTLRELLETFSRDILLKPISWEQTCRDCIDAVRGSGTRRLVILPVGPNNAAQSLQSAFKQCSDIETSMDEKFSIGAFQTQEGSYKQSKIAIVGMAGRFPGGSDLEAFWETLEKGLDMHREIPTDRFDVESHVDPSGKKKNTSHTPFGCFIEEPGLFDNRFFNMSPREAIQTDPMHRLALITAYEALEMSGYSPNRTPSTRLDRIGTFYGQTSDDWREIQDGQDIQTFFIPGGVRAFAPGRINYHFKFSGPSYSVDTACSSSLAAIHHACNALVLGDCDTAVAGGLNVMTNPDIFAGLSRGQFLSKTGNCQTFDDNADGYCRGDSVGSVVLKRLEDAQADNDPILAVVSGWGTNHSAEAVSITHPHAGAQEFLFTKILAKSGIDVQDISYVEMHGTGTQAGDGIEMTSVLNSFAPERHPRKPEKPLYIGSVKANVGHGEAASGITALIKILLMLEKRLIPPHCGIKGKMNHTFPDLPSRNVHISLGKSTPWERPQGDKRYFALNNFSAAGGNTSLLMEDAPASAPALASDPRTTFVVAVAAKSSQSLTGMVKNLLSHMNNNPYLDLASLSYTTTARRIQHNHRVIVSGSQVGQIMRGLESYLSSDPKSPVAPKPTVAFVFTGQGSHYTAMGKEFFEHIPAFRADIEQFNSIAVAQGFRNFLPLVDGSDSLESLGPVVVQVGAICIQMALTRLWQSWGVQPAAAIGHSLGEYAALYAAGVLSASDTIYLVGTRAKLMEQYCTPNTHSMLAVASDVSAIDLDESKLEVSCVNGPKATVISGECDDIDRLSESLTSKGIKSTKLQVPFAFHSAQVEPVCEPFQAAIDSITFEKPAIPVISPLLNAVVTEKGTFSPSYFARHCREAVNFDGALKQAKAQGFVKDNTIFLEIGSHPICGGMVKATLGATALASLRRGDDPWKIVCSTVSALYNAGLDLNWEEYQKPFSASHECLRLPTYAWENKTFWSDYRNNWCLTKGDPVAQAEKKLLKPALSTPSVQKVVEEQVSKDGKVTVVTETNICHPDFEDTIQGHIVNGMALCSSAVYADMALTVADYAYRLVNPDAKEVAMNCGNMVVDRPLIAQENASVQLLRMSCSADLEKGKCDLNFYSVNESGKQTAHHATCTVEFGDSSNWVSEWARQKYLVKSQVNRLITGAQAGEFDTLRKGMAYKLFSVLVEYQDLYKGMAEVVLDSVNKEATARVALPESRTGSQFYIPPYHIDSLAHLAGFIMNANELNDSAETVFVNHGWRGLRFSEKPVTGKNYRSYVRMQSENGRSYLGDVFIFNEDDNIIGQILGLEFQRLPRKILNQVLPPPRTAKTAVSVPSSATKIAKPKKEEPKQVKIATPRSSDPTPPVLEQAITIMADEIGVSVAEMTDDSELAALGVDSLLGLSISGKFRESFEVDLPTTLFNDCITVGDVRQFFAQSSLMADDSRTASEWSTPSLSAGATESSTPTSSTPSGDSSIGVGAAATIALVKSIICEETGMSSQEITSATNLADSGIDSLMSLQILGSLREQCGIDLPATFFGDHETFGDVEKTLGREGKVEQIEPETPANESRLFSRECLDPNAPPATSILVQGNPRIATKSLFLFPDGSGSATSYANIPKVDDDVAIYGLNCPYMKQPEKYTCGIDGVVTLYLKEIRRRQPQGPYYLGGWSAGGVCAYEACLQLQQVGEVVERLILFDAPCPIGLAPLPSRLHNFFGSIGLLGSGGNIPGWLLPHFEYSIKNLGTYSPKPLDPYAGPLPKTYSIIAQDGVCKNPEDPRPEPQADDPPNMKWLLFNRTDFGYNGWDQLLGADSITHIESVPNVNHFTMMREPGAKQLSAHIKAALVG
ncbi:hypothetical protein AJ80_08641 [Polytolypa hystricis UAMH7299]|uniref:Non-reducing polyketide synthase nscA n=1 Tax=Polytolypa hystricis (strain UAMH7299) TaxID=1447883 RepID=A0A2B7X4R6_POLH7|nr:hypothetical protein AJ80_08641 [Polytolypa hystricis UAMH7299]